MVPEAGIEPARYRYRWILSPVRLPVSPLGQRDNYILAVEKSRNIFLFFNINDKKVTIASTYLYERV